MTTSTTADTSGREVLISRLINAPRELVFNAWLDPQQLERWYAPNGCKIEFRRLEAHPGGTFHSCIHTPDGHECWCIGEYREIVRPERIVFTMAVANQAGEAIDAVTAGMDPEWPSETVVTVTFEDSQGQTRLTLQQTVRESLARRTGAYPSWLQMLDRLDAEFAKS